VNLNNIEIDTKSSIDEILDKKIYSKHNRFGFNTRGSLLDDEISSINFSEFLPKKDVHNPYHKSNELRGNKVDYFVQQYPDLYDYYYDTISIDKVRNYENYFPHNNIQRMALDFEQERIEKLIKTYQGNK